MSGSSSETKLYRKVKNGLISIKVMGGRKKGSAHDDDPKHTARGGNGRFGAGQVNHQILTQLNMRFISSRED